MDDIEYMYMSPGLREHSHPLHKKPIRDRGGGGGGEERKIGTVLHACSKNVFTFTR